MPIISPSLLSADFANLGRDVQMLETSAAQWIHVDVMDGVFVPNISFGFPVLKAVRPLTKKVLDVHLMIVEPYKYFKQFNDAGADHLSIHFEGNIHLDSMLTEIKMLGMTAGVALNPSTPVDALQDVIHLLDVVLIMSVNPGFGGQAFIPHSIEKVRQARELISEKNSSARIEVDGGVNLENAKLLVEAGAEILVAGNAVFGDKEPKVIIQKLEGVTFSGR